METGGVTTVGFAEVDRLFYERIRRAVVALGFLPDVTLYNDPTSWQAARDTLAASLKAQGKTMIDVFGVGTWDDRGEKSDARIVINRSGIESGNVGGFPAMFYETYKDSDNLDKFSKKFYPDSTDNISYEIRIVTNKVGMERELSAIMESAMRKRRYMATCGVNGNFTANSVLVLRQGVVDLSDQKYTEKMYRYLVEDVFIEEPELIADNIPSVSSIEFSLYLPPHQENTLTDLTIDVSNVGPIINTSLPYTLPFNTA